MILITGASGFIGKRLLAQLIQLYGVNNVVAYTGKQIRGAQCILHQGHLKSTFNFSDLGYANITTVIHVGAKTCLNEGEDDAANAFLENIIFTSNLLGGQLPRLKKFIFLSTLDVYGIAGEISEENIPNPVTNYGKSKLVCEELILDKYKDSNIIVQILRLGHVYGPGEERYKKIIPVAIKSIAQSMPIKIVGTGEELRSFIYVDDVIQCINASLDLNKYVGPINISGSRRISIMELLNLMGTLFQKSILIQYKATKIRGVDVVLNCSKRIKYLLREECTLEQGLMEEWNHFNKI